MGPLRRLRDRLAGAAPRWVLVGFALIFLVGSVRFCTEARDDQTPVVRIGVDGRYHWAFLTSLVLDGDLDFTNQYADPESGNYYEYRATHTGRLANPFPIGPALLWAPFFIVAHGVALVGDPPHAPSGNSHLHQLITLYGSFLYAFAAMLLAYAMARRRFGPGPAFAGAFAALACGPLLHYTLHQPHYAHAPSAFAVTLLLYVWDAGRGQRTPRGWLALGALIGLAMLVRAQNLVFAAPVVVEAATAAIAAAVGRAGTADRSALALALALARALAWPLAGALVALIVFTPQLLAWQTLYGSYIAIPQGAGYMRWADSLWADTLFSSRNGLFPYAPVWAAGALGLALVVRRDRALGLALLGTFALGAYLNGASSDWSGGGAFGGRRYDGLVAHVTLGLGALVAALLHAAERRPRALAGGLLAVLLVLGAWTNLLLATDFRRAQLAPGPRDLYPAYEGAARRIARKLLWPGGNPLSLPAALAFAWRTGAPIARYEVVVGEVFLTDFRVEQFRKPADEKRDALRFAAPEHEKFLVSGFGGVVRTEARASARPARAARGPRARLLVPLNHAGGVAASLEGTGVGASRLRVLWNGREVAASTVAAGARFAVSFTLAPDAITRGVNVVDLIHDGVPAGAEAARYERLALEER